MPVPEVSQVHPSFLSASATNDFPGKGSKLLHELHSVFMKAILQLTEHAVRTQMRISLPSCARVFVAIVVFLSQRDLNQGCRFSLGKMNSMRPLTGDRAVGGLERLGKNLKILSPVQKTSQILPHPSHIFFRDVCTPPEKFERWCRKLGMIF
jgi:hypothetical protein